MDANKQKALDAALSQIERQFGKGSVMRMGDEGVSRGIDVISTGSLGLDIALGIGGLPKGRVVEIYGPESSGKTTLALQVVAEAQKAGGTAAFVDAEHALDPLYAAKLGVDIDNLLVSQPDTGEQALEITETLVRSGAIDVVIIDPPAFIKRKKDFKEGIIAYRRINQMAMQVLNKGGYLFSASCSYHLKQEQLQDTILKASRHVDRNAQIIEQGHQGPDHPVHPAIPETSYLKSFTARILMN